MATPPETPDLPASDEPSRPLERATTEHVVAHVQHLIDRGALRPGDRRPRERAEGAAPP